MLKKIYELAESLMKYKEVSSNSQLENERTEMKYCT